MPTLHPTTGTNETWTWDTHPVARGQCLLQERKNRKLIFPKKITFTVSYGCGMCLSKCLYQNTLFWTRLGTLNCSLPGCHFHFEGYQISQDSVSQVSLYVILEPLECKSIKEEDEVILWGMRDTSGCQDGSRKKYISLPWSFWKPYRADTQVTQRTLWNRYHRGSSPFD